MKKQIFLLLFAFSFISFKTYATHIVGGEMSYTCLGDNLYQVKLILYRDCAAGERAGGYSRADPLRGARRGRGRRRGGRRRRRR